MLIINDHWLWCEKRIFLIKFIKIITWHNFADGIQIHVALLLAENETVRFEEPHILNRAKSATNESIGRNKKENRCDDAFDRFKIKIFLKKLNQEKTYPTTSTRNQFPAVLPTTTTDQIHHSQKLKIADELLTWMMTWGLVKFLFHGEIKFWECRLWPWK